MYLSQIGSFQPANERKGRYGTIQKFTVPRSARYLIKAWGARGGTHSYNYGYNPGTYYGGKGAYIEGKFRLTKGTVLNIVVGQRGGDSVEVKGGQSTTKTVVQFLNSPLSTHPHIGAEPGRAKRRVQDNLHAHAQNKPIKNY